MRKCLRKLSKTFEIFEEGVSINDIKPKILTEFLATNIAIDRFHYKNDETMFETIRDLIEMFFEKNMQENELKLNSLQVEKIKPAFQKLYKMK